MIYTTGTIAISGNTVAGTGTDFTAPLSLIRVGCTLIAIGNPVQIFTITEIKSGTELSVTPAADPAIPAGTKFSILLSDSLSVDGLAQDVAETLRYYQGRETEISEAVEFFKNFNLQELKDLVKQTEDSANAAKTSEENAAQSEHGALDIKNQTEQLKNETLQEMDAVKQETFYARDEADLARDNANTHANDAKSAKDAAEAARDDAEQFAKQVNPENLLHKDKNLSDIADRAAAWLNVRPIGSTPLSGDPVNDYDATTKRWVLNIVNTGTVGPTMNGVMNYGVGDFHLRDSRAYIQPYEVFSDGQLLNRADWPELWAYAQMLSPIADADWLADPANRGKYSLGDGETTFRVPDRNGVQTGSISGLYARGDGGNSANDGTVQQNAAPNITASAQPLAIYTNVTTSGAFVWSNAVANRAAPPLSANEFGWASLLIDASRSNAAYGRDSTTEVRTNSFIGVWVIRASGGFVAANTSWSVINADATAPANGTTVKGGKVRSVYKVGTSEYGVAELQSSVSTDGTGVRTVGAEVVVTDATSGIATSKTIKLGTVDGLTGGEIGSTITVRGAGLQPKLVASHLDYNPALGGNAIWIAGMTGTENIMQYVTEVTGQYYSLTTVFRVAGQQQFWSQTSTGRYLTPLGELAIQGSDVRIKKDFTPPKEGAWDRVKAIGICEFKYKGQNIIQRGFLAQQMGEIDPIYTFEGGTAHDDEGKEFEILNVNDKAVLADVITVVQMMQDKIEALESQIVALKAAK
ncbi:tail fiber domain-containing protein [Escherichia coli]